MELPIVLDAFSQVPLWKQLFDALLHAIERGQLRNGDPLPPTRELSKQLRVSRDTVVRAYDELVSRGYATATTGAGTFVKFIPSTPSKSPAQKIEVDGLSEYAQRLLNIKPAKATCADYQSLNYGAAPRNMLPAKQWRDVLAHQNELQQPDALTYENDIFGFRPLREELAAYLRRTRGMDCTTEQVVVFSDSQQALDLLSRVLINTGDAAAIEEPGYSGVRETWLAMGAQVHPVSIDQDGLRVQELYRLPAQPKIIYTSPSHHDPTGVVMSLEHRRQLLSWAQSAGAFIVEDGFDSDYRYASMNLPSLQGMDPSRVIYLYSFWKVMYPIVTVGCMVVPESLIEVFERAKLLVKQNFSMVEHCALRQYIADGHLERHIRKTRAIYAQRRQALIFALAQSFRNLISYPKESAGLHLMVRFSESFSEEQIELAAQQACLPIVSTRRYYMGSPTVGEYLIPFASIPETVVGDLVAQMAQLLQSEDGRCA